MSDTKQLADLESAVVSINRDLKSFIEKANGEITETGKHSTESKAAIEKLTTKANETFERLDKLEAKLNTEIGLGSKGGKRADSLGEQFTKSDAWAALQAGRQKSARIDVKAIINATQNTAQPLVDDMRVPGIITLPNRRFTVRDLLPVGRTQSNAVSYTREDVFTNSAAPQYVSPARENVAKPESNITFTLTTAPVITVAHWIPVSRQVLEDSPMLQTYIDGRLIYGLKLEEEDELLNGLGTSGTLNGLINQATAYSRGVTGDNDIDTLRRAITQAQLSEYSVSGIVLNPEDWEAIELTKVGTSDDRYVYGNPGMVSMPTLWGKPVVATNSIPAGSFLLGAFDMGAQIWDRMDAAVEVSREDGTNFVKNMVTILAEERLALTVYRPSAFIKGSIGA